MQAGRGKTGQLRPGRKNSPPPSGLFSGGRNALRARASFLPAEVLVVAPEHLGRVGRHALALDGRGRLLPGAAEDLAHLALRDFRERAAPAKPGHTQLPLLVGRDSLPPVLELGRPLLRDPPLAARRPALRLAVALAILRVFPRPPP